MTPSVAVDLDSTLWPLLQAMQKLPGGERVRIEDCPAWDLLPKLCGGVPKMLELFRQAMTYESMAATPLLPGAGEAMRALADQGVSIHIMTTRPADRYADTERFLREQEIPFATLTVQDPFDKIALCDELGVRVIVDDQPDLLEKAHAAGMDALTLRYRYNQGVIQALGLGHADHWDDLLPQVMAALDRSSAPAAAL